MIAQKYPDHFHAETLKKGLDSKNNISLINNHKVTFHTTKRKIDPKKVVATHDEDKHAKGIVSKFARIKRPSSSENLLKLYWLGNRYLEVNHYDQIQIS